MLHATPARAVSKRVAFALASASIVLATVAQVRGEIFITADSPSNLGGTTWEPNEVVRNDAGTFSLERSLPPGTPLDAIHRMDSGDWLISVSEPTMLGGVFYGPSDIVRYDGASFSLFFDATAAGVPRTANIDALFLLGGDTGDPVISLDIPVSIAGTVFEPADLIRYVSGSPALLFDASAAGIPLGINVLDADERDGRLYLSFDIPATLAGSTYVPGEILVLGGPDPVLRFQNPGWHPGSVVTGLALGNCLDGDGDRFGDPGDARCPGGGVADCNDADELAIRVPAAVVEVVAELAPGGVRYAWTGQSGAGAGTIYDVFFGSAGFLVPSGDFSTGMCRAASLTLPAFEETGSNPPAGDAWYYLMRARNSCGASSWGTANRDTTAALTLSPCQ